MLSTYRLVNIHKLVTVVKPVAPKNNHYPDLQPHMLVWTLFVYHKMYRTAGTRLCLASFSGQVICWDSFNQG